MSLSIDLILFAVYIALVVKSSDSLLENVRAIAKSMGLSELLITLLGISILASLPEFFISLLAALNRSSEISLGTVVGSNIFTLLFVLGLSALLHPFKARRVIERRDSTWMILSASVLLVFANHGISRLEGLAMAMLYLPYIYSVYLDERKALKASKKVLTRETEKKALWILLFMAVLLISAEGVVRTGMRIAAELKLPVEIVALILVGIGSSLPETVIGVSSALKKHMDVTLGDVYGTNIFTALFIIGVSAIVHPIPIRSADLEFVLPFFIFSSIILQLFMVTRKNVTRFEGLALILLYAYFVAAQLKLVPLL